MIQELVSCYCPIFCKIQTLKANKYLLQKKKKQPATQAQPNQSKKKIKHKPRRNVLSLFCRNVLTLIYI